MSINDEVNNKLIEIITTVATEQFESFFDKLKGISKEHTDVMDESSKRIEDSMGRIDKSLDRMDESMGRITESTNRINKSLDNMIGGAQRLLQSYETEDEYNNYIPRETYQIIDHERMINDLQERWVDDNMEAGNGCFSQKDDTYLTNYYQTNQPKIICGCGVKNCKTDHTKEKSQYSPALLKALEDEGMTVLEYENYLESPVDETNPKSVKVKDMLEQLVKDVVQKQEDKDAPFHPRTRKVRQIENRIKEQQEKKLKEGVKELLPKDNN